MGALRMYVTRGRLGNMVESVSISPDKITKNLQLIAAWFAAIVLLDAAFLTAAKAIADPTWVRGLLVIAATGVALLGLVGVFLLQTIFRPQLQDDAYYSQYLKAQQVFFAGFRREAAQVSSDAPTKTTNTREFASGKPELHDLEKTRRSIYAENRGLFLTHAWRPSTQPGQVADIVVKLTQHGSGPLEDGTVTSVEYNLGPKFSREPIVKTKSDDGFALDISAYGPVLCLARVSFADAHPPIELQRYIDFLIDP